MTLTLDVRVDTMRAADVDACAQLLFEATNAGMGVFYDAVLRAAWSPVPMSGAAWFARLSDQKVWVARDGKGIAGFVSLADGDRVDLGYVRLDRLGDGVAFRLHTALIDHAFDAGAARLTAQASVFAEPFLRRQGWTVLDHEHLQRGDVKVRTAHMEKKLRWNFRSTG